MKLWDKGYSIDSLIEDFTTKEDRKLDVELARYDVQGSLAHVKMLRSIGFLSEDELIKIEIELEKIALAIENGTFRIDDGVEDVHSQVEMLLVQAIGEIGKKIHLGRSRNDQVLVDLRLFFRAELSMLSKKMSSLALQLLELSDKNKDNLMPGYTHMQMAMISSFGMWYGAYAESLIEDIQMCLNTKKQINKNPLGTAAGYGSSIPVDRKMTTELLGFDAICVNSVFAQMGRGKTEILVSNVISQISFTIGKMAMDICHYSSQNFRFMKLSNEFTTGSSIMPHKKNPDVFELIRANCNLLSSLPQQIYSVLGNLTSGYHRDFQLLKEILFPAIQKINGIIDLVSYALPQLEIIPPNLTEEKYDYLYSVEVVNELVKSGTPFRDAYKKVGKDIEEGKFIPQRQLHHTHIGSIGNLGNDILRDRLRRLMEG
jgi:argininosuccinate lyase